MCDAVPLKEVHALRDLPGGVQQLLGDGVTGTAGIAEPGAPYSSGDVPDYGRPARQLILAGVSERCVAVVYFIGGFVTTVQLVQFRLNDRHWSAAKPRRLGDIPHSLKEAAALLKSER